MDSITINAVVLPLCAVMLIPDAIRKRKTGEYLGFLNLNVLAYLLAILSMESFFLIDKFGFGFITVLRILGITAMPFIGAYAFVKYSHKQNYGEEFSRNNKKSS